MDRFGMGTFPSGRGMSAERAGATGFGLGLAEFYRLRRESGQRRRRASAPRRARTSATGEIATPDMTRLAGMPPDLYRSGFRAERPRWGVPAAEEGATPLPPFGEVVEEKPDLMEKERRAQYQQDLKEKEKALRNAFYDVTPFTDPSDPIAMKKIEPWEKTDEGEIYRGAKFPMFRGWTREQIQREHEDTRQRLQYIRNPEITLQEIQGTPTPFDQEFGRQRALRRHFQKIPLMGGEMGEIYPEVPEGAPRPFSGGLPPLEERERPRPGPAAPMAERPTARPRPAQPRAAEEPGYMRIEMPTGARIFQRENERTVMHPDGTIEIGPAGEAPTEPEPSGPPSPGMEGPRMVAVPPRAEEKLIAGVPSLPWLREPPASYTGSIEGFMADLGRYMGGGQQATDWLERNRGNQAQLEAMARHLEREERTDLIGEQPPGPPSPGTEVPAGIEPEPEPEPEIEIPERVKARFGARTESFVEALVGHLGIEGANTFMVRNENNDRGLRDMAIKLRRIEQQFDVDFKRERKRKRAYHREIRRAVEKKGALPPKRPQGFEEQYPERWEIYRNEMNRYRASRRGQKIESYGVALERQYAEAFQEISAATVRFLRDVEPDRIKGYEKAGLTTDEQIHAAYQLDQQRDHLQNLVDFISWREGRITVRPEALSHIVRDLDPKKDIRLRPEVARNILNNVRATYEQYASRQPTGDVRMMKVLRLRLPVSPEVRAQQKAAQEEREKAQEKLRAWLYSPKLWSDLDENGMPKFLATVEEAVAKAEADPGRARFGGLAAKEVIADAPWINAVRVPPGVVTTLRTITEFDPTGVLAKLAMGEQMRGIQPGTVSQFVIGAEKIFETIALLGAGKALLGVGKGIGAKVTYRGFARTLVTKYGEAKANRIMLSGVFAAMGMIPPPLEKAVGFREDQTWGEVVAETPLKGVFHAMGGWIIGQPVTALTYKALVVESVKRSGKVTLVNTIEQLGIAFANGDEIDLEKLKEIGISDIQTALTIGIFAFVSGYGGVKAGTADLKKMARSLSKTSKGALTEEQVYKQLLRQTKLAAQAQAKMTKEEQALFGDLTRGRKVQVDDVGDPTTKKFAIGEVVRTDVVGDNIRVAVRMPAGAQIYGKGGKIVRTLKPGEIITVPYVQVLWETPPTVPMPKAIPPTTPPGAPRPEVTAKPLIAATPGAPRPAALAGTYQPTPREQSKALVRVGDAIDRTKGRVTPQLVHEAIQPIVPAGQTLSRETMDMLLRSSREGVRKARAEGKSYRKWVAERIRTAPDKAMKQWRRLSPERDPNPWEKRLLDAGRSPEAILSRRREMKELFKRAKRDKWPKKRVSREIYGMFAVAPPGRAEPAPAVAEAPGAPAPTPREGEIVAPEPTAAPPGAPERPPAAEVAPAEEIVPMPAEAAPVPEAARADVPVAPVALAGEKGPPGPPAEGPVERFVWRANRESGQEIGNLQEIRPVGEPEFDRWIRPLYGDNPPTYADWKAENPDDVISLVKVGDREWEPSFVAPREEMGPDIEGDPHAAIWAKKVESFDLPKARQWRLTADSGEEVAAVLKPVHELTMKEWAEQGADVIEARGRRILERIQAKELPASLETGARQDILTAQHVRKGKISGQFKHEHKDRIERALARGEMVPEHVLAEHGLKAKPAKAPAPAAPAKAAPPEVEAAPFKRAQWFEQEPVFPPDLTETSRHVISEALEADREAGRATMAEAPVDIEIFKGLWSRAKRTLTVLEPEDFKAFNEIKEGMIREAQRAKEAIPPTAPEPAPEVPTTKPTKKPAKAALPKAPRPKPAKAPAKPITERISLEPGEKVTYTDRRFGSMKVPAIVVGPTPEAQERITIRTLPGDPRYGAEGRVISTTARMLSAPKEPAVVEPERKVAVDEVNTAVPREKLEGKASALGSAAWVQEGEIHAIHMTEDPGPMLKKLTEGGNILLTSRGEDLGDLGGGLYVSASPDFWVPRAGKKWGFLYKLSEDQRRKLGEAIHADLDALSDGYLTRGERETANQLIENFVEKNLVVGFILLCEPPYNRPFWHSDFLEPLGIKQPGMPVSVPVRIKGKFAKVDHLLDADELRQLREQGFDGAFLAGDVATPPQLAVWNREAVVQFGDFKRTEGKLEVVATRMPTGNPLKPLWEAPAKTKSIMPDGTPFEFREALVRRGDLISSHLSSGDPNPNFPQDLQGRATFTAASAILRANITNAPDFGLLSRKENVAVGSPVCCRPRSFVLVGRNRVSALQMADFSSGKPKLYKDQLNEWAKDKGDRAVKAAKDPDAILVRVLESEIPDVAAFTRAADVPELRPYTIYEQATEDAAKMPEDLYGLSVIEGDETLRAALARQNQVRKAMIEHLFTTEEQVLYASSTAEKLTTEGMNRIERAVLAKSTGMSAPMLQQIFEEHGIFKEGLLRASPAMAEMRARMAKGEVAPEWDLTTDFEAMVQSLREIEKAGMNVETALNQVDAFGKSFVATPRQENLLRLLYAYRSHPKLLGEAFKGYVRDAIGSIGEPVQADLLGTVAPPANNANESLKMLRQKAAEWNRSRFKKKAEERKQHGGLGGMTLQVRYKKTPSQVKEPEAHYGSLIMNPAPEGQQVLGTVPTRFAEMQAAVGKNPLCDDLILDFKGGEWDQMILVSAAELKAQGTEPGSREWQVCKLNPGDYSDDPDKETFAIEVAGLHFRDPFDSSRWRAVLATSATEAAFVEELVHHIQRKLPEEAPTLATRILRLENRWKNHALQRGIVIPDGLELFAKAMTFNIAGHAAQDPEIAELLQIPRSIGKAFLELMGQRRTGKPNYKPFIGLMEPRQLRLADKPLHRPPPPGARRPTQKVDLYTAFQIKKPPGPPKDPDIAAMVGGDEPLPDQPLTIELAPEPIKKLLADNRNIFRRPAETILRRVKGVREMFFTLHDFVLRFGEVKRLYPELWKRLMGHFAERNAAVERSDDIVEKAAHKYVQIKTPAGLEMTYAYEDPDYKLPKELAENKDFMVFHHDLTSAFKMYEAEKIKHGLIRAGGFQERMAQEARDKIELLKRNLTKMGYPGERQEVLDLPASKEQQAILDQIAELEDWIKVVKRKEYVPKGVVARAYTAMIMEQGGKPMRQFIGGLTRLSAHFPERKGVRTMKDYVEAGLVKPEQADFRKLLIDHIYDFYWRSSLKSLYDFAHARGFIKPIASDYMREQFARAGWYTGREIGITAPEVRGKMIHPVFARALAELKWRPRFKGPLGRVRRFFGLVKMAQFIKMFFMPQYNVIQHFKSGAAIANPIRSAKLLGDAWWHVHNRTSFYHKLDSLNLYQYPIDVPRAQREEMAIMALRRMSANVPWFINQLEARTGMSWRKGDVTALDILMIGNRFITNFVWPVDRVQRTHSTLTFMEQGFPLEEAVQRAASAHAAYSEISQRFGDWAGLITFVHSFRFLMPREQARTLAEPFRILIDYKAGKKIPPRRSKVAAKRLAFLFLLTFGVDLLMTTFGFEREKFAWKYKKRVFDEKTGKWYEIIVPVNTIANMPIKWGHRILDPGPPWKRGVVPFAYGLRSFFHWEMHPVWRVLVDVSRNRSSFGARREVYDESDSMLTRGAKSAKYMFGQYFRIYGRLMDAAEMGSITMEEAKIHTRILRENFSPAVLSALRVVSYPYVRAPNERLAKWASLQANMEHRHRAGRLKGRYARMRTEIEATYSGASRERKLEKLERWYSKRGKRLADEKREWFMWIRKKYLLEEG